MEFHGFRPCLATTHEKIVRIWEIHGILQNCSKFHPRGPFTESGHANQGTVPYCPGAIRNGPLVCVPGFRKWASGMKFRTILQNSMNFPDPDDFFMSSCQAGAKSMKFHDSYKVSPDSGPCNEEKCNFT